MEGTRPDWRARSVNAQEVKGVPWSEWITVSGSGWRLPIAIPRAEVTRPAVAERSMDQLMAIVEIHSYLKVPCLVGPLR